MDHEGQNIDSRYSLRVLFDAGADVQFAKRRPFRARVRFEPTAIRMFISITRPKGQCGPEWAYFARLDNLAWLGTCVAGGLARSFMERCLASSSIVFRFEGRALYYRSGRCQTQAAPS